MRFPSIKLTSKEVAHLVNCQYIIVLKFGIESELDYLETLKRLTMLLIAILNSKHSAASLFGPEDIDAINSSCGNGCATYVLG